MNNLAEQTGYSNVGKLYRYAEDVIQIPDKLMKVYMGIGRRSLGYCRPTTNLPAELNKLNFNNKRWAKSLSISLTKFKDSIRELDKLGIIKIHTGSQFREGGGSYSNYYSIKFDPELQRKHNIYFNIEGVKPKEAKPQAHSISPERIKELQKENNLGA